jgi:hypothetical protein
MPASSAEVSLRKAFKEWAVVCRAVREGVQTVILRKGGIAEHDGRFRPEFPEFLLFPTFTHQTKAGIRPEFHSLVGSDWNSLSADEVRIDTFASVARLAQVDDESMLPALEPFHVWTEEIVRKRFRRWREQMVHAIVIRAYRLAEPVRVAMKPEYGGCSSWADLEASVSIAEAEPVLDDSTFSATMESISAALSRRNS